jgi:hypothetical protein
MLHCKYNEFGDWLHQDQLGQPFYYADKQEVKKPNQS